MPNVIWVFSPCGFSLVELKNDTSRNSFLSLDRDISVVLDHLHVGIFHAISRVLMLREDDLIDDDVNNIDEESISDDCGVKSQWKNVCWHLIEGRVWKEINSSKDSSPFVFIVT